MVARSRLQKEVLSLYRQFLTAAKGKPGVEVTIKQEFKQNKSIPKNDTLRIEFLLRKGIKKLEMIKDPQITGIGHFVEKG